MEREQEDLALADAIDGDAADRASSVEASEQLAARALLAGLSHPTPPTTLADEVMHALRAGPGSTLARLWQQVTAPRTLTLRWNLAALTAGLLLLGGAAALLLGRADATLPPATERVTLQLVAPDASFVAVAGEFNDWRTDTHLLQPTPGDGSWSIILELPPGRYEYVFVVDGTRWVTDPRAARYRPDGFGGHNAILEL